MRKAFLKKARETLARDARADAPQRSAGAAARGGTQNKDEGMDTYDLASDARDREISHILTDRDREQARRRSTRRSRASTTAATACARAAGRTSPKARLEALPFTRLCVTCQAERERELRMNQRYEEDRTFRRSRVERRRRRRILSRDRPAPRETTAATAKPATTSTSRPSRWRPSATAAECVEAVHPLDAAHLQVAGVEGREGPAPGHPEEHRAAPRRRRRRGRRLEPRAALEECWATSVTPRQRRPADHRA